MRAVLYAFLCSLLISTGQVLWKVALNRNGGLLPAGVPLLDNFMRLFSSPYMLAGLAIYAVATVFWMFLLGKYDYSYIYPLLSMVYIIALAHAALIFHEQVGMNKWIGVIFIIAGIFFISR